MDEKKVEKEKKKNPKTKSRAGIGIFVIGIIALVAGIVLLLVNLLAKPAVRDADFLVSVGKWEMESNSDCVSDAGGEQEMTADCVGGSGVIWDFTEIGKGKLTTNNHVNDYDFLWSLDKNEMKIETAWLYTLNNTYSYKLDQDKQILTLTTGEGENSVSINFHPASSADAEVVQDN